MMNIDDSGKRLISNSFYLMADWVMATILSLIFWLVVSRLFSPAGYGIVATTVNTSLLIAAIGMVGVNAVVANLIPRFVKENKMDKVRGLIKFSIRFVLIVSIVSSFSLAILSPQVADILNLPLETIWLASMMIFVWSFWFLTNGLFQGLQNMKLYFKSSLVGQIIKVVLPLALFFIGLDILGPIIAFTVSMLATILIRLPFLPRGKISPVDGKEVVLKLGMPIFIASVMWLVFTNLPNVILNSIKSPDVTGIFALALTLVTPIVFIPMTLSQALFPVTSGLSVTSNPKRRQSELISLVIKFAAFITIPLIALLLIFSDQIILLFSGKVENLPASQILPLIAPAAILLGIGQILVSSIFAIGKLNATRNITIAATALFVGLSIPATYMFSSFGMGAAYLVSMIFLALTSYLYLRKEIGLKLHWPSILKILVATLVFAAITFPLNSILHSVPLKLLALVVGAVAYLAVLFPLKYYSKDEVGILRHLSARSKLLKNKIGLIERLLSKYS